MHFQPHPFPHATLSEPQTTFFQMDQISVPQITKPQLKISFSHDQMYQTQHKQSQILTHTHTHTHRQVRVCPFESQRINV